MRITITSMLMSLAAAFAVVVSGCSPAVTETDVRQAREEVAEERAETDQARQEANEEMAEADRELRDSLRDDDDGRHAVGYRGDTINGNALEENRDARQDAQENIAEEEQETRDAQAELQETEQKFATQQARDEYVAHVNKTIEHAEVEIDSLQEQADLTEDEAAKADLNSRIEKLEAQKDRVEEKLSELESAEDAQWQLKQQQIEQELNMLNASIRPTT